MLTKHARQSKNELNDLVIEVLIQFDEFVKLSYHNGIVSNLLWHSVKVQKFMHKYITYCTPFNVPLY